MQSQIMDLILHLLLFLTISNVVSGQVVSGPDDTTVERGGMVELMCSASGTEKTPTFNWHHITTGVTIFKGGERDSAPDTYLNFEVDELTNTTHGVSSLRISEIEVENEGSYQCEIPGEPGVSDARVTVEVKSTLWVGISSPLGEDIAAFAQCDAVGGRPQENLTWYINDVEQTTVVVVTNPTNPTPGLSNTRSVLIFTPTAANNGQILSCRITGHELPDLNQRNDTTLQVWAAPTNESIAVTVEDQGTSLLVTCNITADPPQHPPINNYIIFQDGDVISNNNTALVSPLPESCTNFTCTASNDHGKTTAVAPEYCPPVVIGAPPTIGSIAVMVEDRGTSLLVTCNISVVPPPNPPINNYVIFQNGNAISNNNTGIVSPVPESCIKFTCTASNELGNTTAVVPEYCPDVVPTVTLKLDAESEILAAGDTYIATCMAIGGRPPQNITWFLESTPITTGIVSSVSDNENPRLSDTVSQLTLTPTAANHWSTLSCRSSSGASRGILLRVLQFCTPRNNVPID